MIIISPAVEAVVLSNHCSSTGSLILDGIIYGFLALMVIFMIFVTIDE